MQRLGQLDGYTPLGEKEIVTFRHPESSLENSRLVKLRVIAENETALYYAVGAKPAPDAFQLLTVVCVGFDEIEFYVLGDFHLAARGGEILISTFDNSSVYLGPDDTESFARLWEREERDPRILEIERLARHNAEALRLQMAADFAAHEARMREITNGGNLNSGPARASVADAGGDGTGSSEAPAGPDGNDQVASGEEGGQS